MCYGSVGAAYRCFFNYNDYLVMEPSFGFWNLKALLLVWLAGAGLSMGYESCKMR